ncbi:MAG TPA: helix-turn-helix domain-containing protein [Verrucomicrobiota bacterium]|nr:helix-turn-helix domain-containing protein [candidate division Zixibacteria bacterium]HOC00752.1 helix-turn-helix domain-containing protein [Verrucomicrobiota bacterium]MDD4918407.1 helix-turn-helix domain-containing protein [candidate division Zixibacteria bacterium]MDM7972429.1 helix-turn-helix domain-containing protein [candidate division Zixibacteria bacterium]HOY58810.1 helix-turn-helix domain-containing protein [Verrucomicrobiota bacterium]
MNKLLTPQEAADLLGVKKSTIYQWTSQEYIPHVKLRNLVRFRAEDLDEWIATLTNNGRTSRRVDVNRLMS